MKLSQRRASRPSLGGLMATRQGALVLALICAVAATGVLMFALGRYKTNVKAPVTPQATVLVATRQIAKGTSSAVLASGGLYRPTPIVATQLAPGAISDASMLSGKVAAAAILPGQQLTVADFTAVPGATTVLGPDQRAVSLTIAGAGGGTGVVQAGDRVDVYSQFTSKSSGKLFEVLLLRGAQVLQAPGATPVAAAAKAATPSSGAVVLAVTSEQVPRVIYAAQNGQLYLTLRPATATNTPNGITTLTSVVAASLADTTTGATK